MTAASIVISVARGYGPPVAPTPLLQVCPRDMNERGGVVRDGPTASVPHPPSISVWRGATRKKESWKTAWRLA